MLRRVIFQARKEGDVKLGHVTYDLMRYCSYEYEEQVAIWNDFYNSYESETDSESESETIDSETESEQTETAIEF